VLAPLAALLAADDTAAIDFLEGHEPALRQALAQDYEAVRRRIEAFDFAAALSTVQRTLRRTPGC
jgi:hypothetical protein